MGSRPTIDDVAALAQVGRATVSRALNGHPNVSAAVRERVRRAVETLGYRVNLQARGLAGRTTRRISMIHGGDFDSEPNSYFSAALELGATRACVRLGAQLLAHVVDQNDTDTAAQVLRLVDDDQCDGVILTPPFADDVALLQALTAAGIRSVSIAGGLSARRETIVIGIDDRQAGQDVGAHLIAQGHRRFGFIKGLQGHVSAESRYDGFLQALADAGLGEEAVVTRRGNFTFRSGLDHAAELLAGPVSALVCANDDMAAGALLAAHKAGRRIPHDIAITGFDDTPVSRIVWPPLTTIHQPLCQMAARAVERLVDASAPGQPDHEVIPHALMPRESSLPDI